MYANTILMLLGWIHVIAAFSKVATGPAQRGRTATMRGRSAAVALAAIAPGELVLGTVLIAQLSPAIAGLCSVAFIACGTALMLNAVIKRSTYRCECFGTLLKETLAQSLGRNALLLALAITATLTIAGSWQSESLLTVQDIDLTLSIWTGLLATLAILTSDLALRTYNVRDASGASKHTIRP